MTGCRPKNEEPDAMRPALFLPDGKNTRSRVLHSGGRLRIFTLEIPHRPPVRTRSSAAGIEGVAARRADDKTGTLWNMHITILPMRTFGGSRR